MSKYLLLMMEKAGKFKPAFTPNPASKCDLPEHDIYRFHCKVLATDEVLTPEGFILDNVKINEFFDTAYNGLPQMSCERMAAHGARGIGTLLHGMGISVRTVTVKIGGSNGAWLTAQWHITEIHRLQEEDQ